MFISKVLRHERLKIPRVEAASLTHTYTNTQGERI